MTWVLANLDLIAGLALEHLRQSALPIVLGFLIAIPLGWVAFRYRLTRGAVLTVTGLLYTIPSLALFALLPPTLGISYLSEANLVIALTIYAVAILARSVADALGSVDPAVRQAAVAIGYGPWRRFWTVEFPLAGPVVLAGLRVAAVSTISLATVGILIGVDNLGYLFTNGLQRRIIPEVFAGVVAVMAIALIVDALLVLAGRLLMPWARRDRGRRAVRAARVALPDGGAA
ncbi:ABC transporter permease [Protaetiibacter sp. SSC-01]|uniref:ABC transporter permease n=1 Tax=Protaetiibacter sp. SSC-01 TaxID=2759943 RepID=UPI001656B4D8|nr:ABC transporter permease [Protaetiibacter sp. SSC-01]QNO36674.1 ABC transporter permease [Protaetiibacter sp. SSC-01]